MKLMSGVSSEPITPMNDSGQAEPNDDMKNNVPATISPPRRPSQCATTPPRAPPMMQPASAQEMVQPSRLMRALSGSPSGATKFSLIESVAPEMTAVS